MNSLLLTAHDYRTPRRANMHFIAEELAKRGAMRFFSLRYSALSTWKNDARCFLDRTANRVERVDGVDCYLWKAAIHPFNMRRRSLRRVEDWMFRRAMTHPPAMLVQWMREADVIFFESGSAIVHVDLACRVNPRAKLVYIASDDLEVIEVPDFVIREFERVAKDMDALCLPSPRLAAAMPAGDNRYFVPHGLDAGMLERAGPSPYTNPLNAVSVGSMLFDRTFFEVAGPAFPQVEFHIVGSGLANGDGLTPNVHVYGEMAHDETLRFIKHANVGIAPYTAGEVPSYLIDTSMKLMQYAFFGVPAVCPNTVSGELAWRFGYQPGSPDSMRRAVSAALAAESFVPPHYLSWSDVTDRLINPAAFADTALLDRSQSANDPSSSAVAERQATLG